MICAALISAAAAVWVERPGFPSLGAAIAAGGGRLVHVTVDDEGMDVADGLAQAPKARLACVAPSHQYPLGVVMSLQRRLALLAWAREAKAWMARLPFEQIDLRRLRQQAVARVVSRAS